MPATAVVIADCRLLVQYYDTKIVKIPQRKNKKIWYQIVANKKENMVP